MWPRPGSEYRIPDLARQPTNHIEQSCGPSGEDPALAVAQQAGFAQQGVQRRAIHGHRRREVIPCSLQRRRQRARARGPTRGHQRQNLVQDALEQVGRQAAEALFERTASQTEPICRQIRFSMKAIITGRFHVRARNPRSWKWAI